jgi:hypothetical protein
MKARNYILFMLLSLLGTACERTLDFMEVEETSVSDLTLNAIAVTGSPLKAFLSRTLPINKTPDVTHIDEITEGGAYHHGSGNTVYFDYLFWDYYKETALYDAELKAVVNGTENYVFTLAPDSIGFNCDYVPREGDHIVLTAKYGNVEIQAEATVPISPQIDILGKEELDINPYREYDGMSFDTDSLTRITCHINDRGGEQFYRLRVRDENSFWVGVRTPETPLEYFSGYAMQDVFYSTDALFVDNRLNSNFGGWPAYFSNIFDNTLLTNDYIFTIDSPRYVEDKNLGWTEHYESYISGKFYNPPTVMVELQALTKDLYKYLKSMELYRLSSTDEYAEPVHIHGNVKNGWGIFGALSYDRHVLELNY